MASLDQRTGLRLFVDYTLALVVCALAALAQIYLEPLLGDQLPFAAFSAAVAAAAWSGGPGPGLLATLGGTLLSWYLFLEPRFSLTVSRPGDWLALALFVLTGILISLAMRHLRRQAATDRDARDQAERRLAHTAHLQDLTSALSRANTPTDVTRACIVELVHALDAAAGAFACVTEDGQAYEYVSAVGFPSELGAASHAVPLTVQSPMTAALRRHDLVVVPTRAEADQEFPARAEDPCAAGHEAAVVVPIFRASRPVGGILLLFDAARLIDGDEREFLQAASSRTAQALERARLYELTERARAEAEDYRATADLQLRERQRAEARLRDSEAKYRGLAARTSRLYELSAGLSEAVTVDAVATVIVHQGKAVVGASAAAVALLNDGEFQTLHAEDYPRGTIEEWTRFGAEPGLMSTAAVASKRPVLAPSFAELQRDYPSSASIAADGGFASAAALPLLIENSVMGVLTIHFTAPVNFDAGYEALLLSVAQHCAQALDRARLYEAAQVARKVAEEANRSKDEFLSTVSHELRTPLNAMLGWASLLRNGSLDTARTARAIEAIFSNATRQAHLIEELLDVSRIVAGRAALDPQPLDVGDNIRGAVEAILPLAEAKGVSVSVTTPPGVTVLADPRRLEQVFLNVLSNAVKFTPAGGRIGVDMTPQGDRVDVRVKDTGAGIDPAFLPHVFERFRQADSTMARSVGGLGLGLFIARHLVEAQGGRITAASEGVGAGSTFTVSLPVVATRSVATEPRPNGVDVADAAASAPRLHGIRVLLVDDEADTREVMASALETCGATVRTVASATDALTTLAGNPFDVLLSDIAMPGRDGYTLIQEIRGQAGAAYAGIPAAAVTASAGEDERRRALLAGFQDHLAKPVQPTVLAHAVARLAGSRRHETGAIVTSSPPR